MDIKLKLSVLRDIRFWLVFFFLIRLYGITFPPLEVGHNWRQTDVLMIARNFYEVDANIFFPRVDVAGEKTGIVGSEFPILNYLIYLVSVVVGYDHWYGRLIVLIFSTFGILFFHKLIRKFYGEAAAFNASILLLVSLWFSYSRKIIPDAFAVSLCIMSLYFACMYLEQGRLKNLILFFFLGLLGCLAKILAATILTVLLLPILDAKISIHRKMAISFLSGLILMGVCWWYFIWVPYLNGTYGLEGHFFMGLPYSEGVARILHEWNLVLKRFYSTPFKYIGFVVFVVALILMIRFRQWKPLTVFLLPFLSFLFLLVKTGTSVIGDHYYLITVIPSMAFIIGVFLARFKNSHVAIVLVVIGIESIGDQIYDFRIRQPYRALAGLEAILSEVSSPKDLIFINAETHNPTAMYFAHRRGWNYPSSGTLDVDFLDDIRKKGCKFIVIAKKLYGELDLEYRVVHDSEYFKIYKISP